MGDSFYANRGKRILDLLASVIGLALLSPLFVVIGLLIKAAGRGPVFFRQVRVGQNGVPFRIYKFRSMTTSESGHSALLTSAKDPRVTPVGRWLRKSKLDELPQLINVFLGQMSRVGPRPEVPRYCALYTEEERQTLAVRPGITGLVAMINVGEEELLASQSDQEEFYRTVLMPAKLRIEAAYCRRIRFWEDLRILFGTFFKIFRRSSDVRGPLLHRAEKQV